MSSYQVQFYNNLKGNIQDLKDKLTADEDDNLTHSLMNTCYWAKALQQTFCDMGDVGMMLAMGTSCDFNLVSQREKELTEAHDKKLRKAVVKAAQIVTDANQGE
mgnify:CR=1 FL=1